MTRQRDKFIPIQSPETVEVIVGEWPSEKVAVTGNYTSTKYLEIRKSVDDLVRLYQEGQETHICIGVNEDSKTERERRQHAYGAAAKRYFKTRYKEINSRLADVILETHRLTDGTGLLCRLVPKK